MICIMKTKTRKEKIVTCGVCARIQKYSEVYRTHSNIRNFNANHIGQQKDGKYLPGQCKYYMILQPMHNTMITKEGQYCNICLNQKVNFKSCKHKEIYEQCTKNICNYHL